jgi:hypothetical protein
MAARVVSIEGGKNDTGWLMRVTVADRTSTTHTVRISRAEHERYGGGDVIDLVRRSFEFLLEREGGASILREFDLSTIERYFPEYSTAIHSR